MEENKKSKRPNKNKRHLRGKNRGNDKSQYYSMNEDNYEEYTTENTNYNREREDYNNVNSVNNNEGGYTPTAKPKFQAEKQQGYKSSGYSPAPKRSVTTKSRDLEQEIDVENSQNSSTKKQPKKQNKPQNNFKASKNNPNNVNSGYQKQKFISQGDVLDTHNIVGQDYSVPFSQMESLLRPTIEKNQKMQQRRLNSFNKLDFNTDAKIRVTPLGGLGEIGGNITIFETEDEAILVDMGLSFPDETMHGVDILIPDFTYLRQIEHKIIGLIITHGHEDHIGAIPYLFKEFQFPLYATPLPLAMILNKFQEHKIAHYKSFFRPVEKRQVIDIGNDFRVEWIHITHSIIDSSSLAITTEAGTIIHTGDFKIDHTPIDGYPTDLHRLAYYGEKGVLALLSDSTNSHNSGMTKSENVIFPTFDRIFAQAKGRLIMSTFSSNIHRVYQAIAAGIKYGRKVCVIGRSMERNIETAINYDYIRLDKEMFIEPHQLNRYKDNEVLIVTTGSQGENNSALFRISRNEHRMVKIKPTDAVILSARAIPGNESSISTIINYLEMLGAKVHHRLDNIHVSGHASQEEQKLMIRLIKPKFFLPVHGEFNHTNAHRITGRSCGIPDKNIFIMKDGDQIEIHPKFIKKVKHVKSGKSFIDNQNNVKIENDIIANRQALASDGIVIFVAQVSKDDNNLIIRPNIKNYGLISEKSEKFLANDLIELFENFLDNLKPQLMGNPKALEGDFKNLLKKYLYRKYKKYPLLVLSVFVI